MNSKTILTDYVRALLSSLKDHGVEQVVISPGSRSTPLAYGVVSDIDFSASIQVDERSAAFYALGMAKASEKPVALICTSGSAAANYFPAIVEAYYARIPLIVLTADRPHELRQVGAPQTIDQVKLYGQHVKWAFDFPIPEQHTSTNTFLYQQAARGIATSMTAPRGPVHFNIPFREPLLLDFEMPVAAKQNRQFPLTEKRLAEQEIMRLSKLFADSHSGIVVAGEIPLSERRAVENFLIELGWPVLADPLSNLRSPINQQLAPLIIENYDALLKNEDVYSTLQPDTVIRIGAQPVSKFLGIFLQQGKPSNFIVVDEHPIYRDSFGLATDVLIGPATMLADIPVNTAKDHMSLSKWQLLNNGVRELVKSYIHQEQDEGSYVGTLLKSMPNDTILFASSSMPIRDVDTFLQVNAKRLTILANRGTNGIDGVLSTALGVQKVAEKPLYLLIGDLAMLHDSNGLILSRYQQTDATIVIMNNDGGGIFSYLPQSQEQVYFEKLFGTATGLTFESLAAMYGIAYTCVESKEEFAGLIRIPSKGLRIIEVKTIRSHNTATHRTFWQNVKTLGSSYEN